MLDGVSPQISGRQDGFAHRVTLAYAIVGSLWIIGFDVILPIFFTGSPYRIFWEVAEGWIYVSTTSMLLYLLVKRHLATLNQVNSQLRKKEQYLTKVLETLPIGVWLVDAKGKVVQSNSAAKVLKKGNPSFLETGNSADQGWLMNGEVFLGEDSQQPDHYGETVLNKVVDIACLDGSPKTVLHSSASLRDDEGRIIGTVVVNQDITEVKRIERELRENQNQLTSLAAELSMAEERERRRIATELHDQIGQSLALCKIRLNQLAPPTDKDAAALAKITELINATIYQVRTLTFEVSPPLLYEVGLEAALEWLGERFHEQYNFYFRFQAAREIPPLPEEIRVTVFQIVRELLMNVAKHAQATSVELTVAEEGGNLLVTLKDDGNGFEVLDARASEQKMTGFGLFNARRRIEHLGGVFNLVSRHGKGTSVLICLPLTKTPAIGGSHHAD